MSRLKRTAVAAAVLLGMYFFVGTVIQPLTINCHSSALLQSADSPDEQYTARIYVQSCKDPTRDGTYLFIARLKSLPGDKKRIVPGTVLPNVSSRISVDILNKDFALTWRQDKDLEITVPSDVDWDDLRFHRDSFEGVRIEYRKAQVQSP
jgi:hypothetical protein